jgi:hypothetical protein
MVRILIADDSSVVRQALHNFIDLQPVGWFVVKLPVATM